MSTSNGHGNRTTNWIQGITCAGVIALVGFAANIFATGMEVGVSHQQVKRNEDDIEKLAGAVRDLAIVSAERGVTVSDHERRLNEIVRRLEAHWWFRQPTEPE